MTFKDKFYEHVFNNNIFRGVLNKLLKIVQLSITQKKIYRNERILNELFSLCNNKEFAVALDIGSGPNPKNPFSAEKVYGADLRENKSKNVVFSDFSSGKLPFENDKFDFLTAFDVLEHIPRNILVNGKTIYPFISLMNEVFRILKPEGIFFSIQPVYPSKTVFQDPTHVNIMSEDTLDFYFCSKSWARIYGYEGSFEMMEDGWIGDKYFCFIKKSAKEPINDVSFVQK